MHSRVQVDIDHIIENRVLDAEANNTASHYRASSISLGHRRL